MSRYVRWRRLGGEAWDRGRKMVGVSHDLRFVITPGVYSNISRKNAVLEVYQVIAPRKYSDKPLLRKEFHHSYVVKNVVDAAIMLSCMQSTLYQEKASLIVHNLSTIIDHEEPEQPDDSMASYRAFKHYY